MAKKQKATHDIIATGQRWKLKGDGDAAYWTVMSVSEAGMIGMQGPGPCRAYKQLLDDELLSEWEQVP